jgi:hypothetical protein
MSDRDDEGRGSAADPAGLPRRLFAEPGREGELVRRYLRRPHDGSEERAWRRLAAASADGAAGKLAWRAPRRRGLWLASLAGAGALAVLAVVASRPPRPPASVATSTPSPARSPNASRAPELVLGPIPQALGPGRWTIAGEATGDVTADGVARAELGVGGAPTMTLLSGGVSLSVLHKERPAPFRVVSPPFTFTVLGTVFRVERRPKEIGLVVVEGRVAVSRAGRELATVAGGQSWSESLGPTGAPAPPTNASRKAGRAAANVASAAGEARDGAAPSCAADLPSRERGACLRAQANGAGLSAETALYELAKLTRDDLRDPAGALAALEELRRRFPGGALRVETDLSAVELLARVGRYGEALDESAAVLSRGATSEQEAELHLLRGNVYREALGDLTRAVDEYRLAAERATRRPIADEAAFLHAVATEALGRRDAAAELYRRYLARPQPAHESAARARLDGLVRAAGGPR